MYVSILYTNSSYNIYLYLYIYIYFAINIFSKLLSLSPFFVIYIEIKIINNCFFRFMATVTMENAYKLIYY